MSLFFGASATFLYITYFLLNFVNHIDLKRIKIQQNYRVHISHWSVISKSALRGRRINNFIELWCLAGSGGLDIWVSSTNFQKSNIGWPQQPLTERVLKFSMIFPDSTPIFKCDVLAIALLRIKIFLPSFFFLPFRQNHLKILTKTSIPC